MFNSFFTLSLKNAVFVTSAIVFTLSGATGFADSVSNQIEPAKKADGPQRGSNQKLIEAIRSRRNVNFIEGEKLKVVQILPDDTSGAEHQKFVVQTETGEQVLLVYNLDMCERVPVEVGDEVGAGGQFVWTNQGALLHWLHRDPRNNRPDGYVEFQGKFYCK